MGDPPSMRSDSLDDQAASHGRWPARFTCAFIIAVGVVCAARTAGADTCTRAEATLVAAEAICTDPESFLGARVRIRHEIVGRLPHAQLFTLSVASCAAGELLVAIPYIASGGVPGPGDRVDVSGRVWPSHPDLYVSSPSLSRLTSLFATFIGRPLVVADSVRTAAHVELVRAGPRVRSIAGLVEGIDQLLLGGRDAWLTGVVVERHLAPRRITIRDADRRTLVVEGATGGEWPQVQPGRQIDIRGVVGILRGSSYPWGLLRKPPPGGMSTGSALCIIATRLAISEAHK
jgi:hypothetical protein